MNRYQLARELWQEMSADRGPGDQELVSITDAFEKGQASIMEVLATRDNLIQERQTYFDLLNQVSQAAVDVVAALAIDPERLIESPQSMPPTRRARPPTRRSMNDARHPNQLDR